MVLVLLMMLMMLMMVLMLMLAVVVAVVKGPMRYPQYQIRLHDVWRLSPAAHQSDKGQLLLSVRCQGDTKYHSILTSLARADIEISRGGKGGGGEMLLSSRPSCIYSPHCGQWTLWTLWTLWTPS